MYKLLKQLSTLYSSKMEILNPDVVDVVITHSQQTSYKQHVSGPPSVIFNTACLLPGLLSTCGTASRKWCGWPSRSTPLMGHKTPCVDVTGWGRGGGGRDRVAWPPRPGDNQKGLHNLSRLVVPRAGGGGINKGFVNLATSGALTAAHC